MHQKDLPPEPRTWRDLERHQFGDHFRKAAELEYKTLEIKNTWTPISRTNYQLVGFKARLVVRGDLFKSSKEDVHAATLAAKVFRLLIAICAYFDLEIHQF
ncbi:hypothetical protein BGZ57DRAFT_776670, partial [Hyaloscypha finlandica]